MLEKLLLIYVYENYRSGDEEKTVDFTKEHGDIGNNMQNGSTVGNEIQNGSTVTNNILNSNTVGNEIQNGSTVATEVVDNKENINLIDQKPNKVELMDEEVTLFGRYVASQLRKMAEPTRTEVQFKVHEVLFRNSPRSPHVNRTISAHSPFPPTPSPTCSSSGEN